jgi:DNA-binding GntR family transcriptional regulator
MRAASDAKSLTEAVYATLRADVLTCRAMPGQRLKISDLCSALGANLSAVREALSRLAAEGLVVSEPQKGFYVAPVSMDDLKDLTRTRVDIESLCLRYAMDVRGVEWEARILSSTHRLAKTAEHVAGDEFRLNEDWVVAHAEFHEALVSACDSPWLLRLRATLYTQSERYRRLSKFVPRPRNLYEEHQEITDAVLSGDKEWALALLRKHLVLTGDLVTHLVSSDADPAGRPSDDGVAA